MQRPVYADGRKCRGADDMQGSVLSLVTDLDGVTDLLVDIRQRGWAKYHLIRASNGVPRQQRGADLGRWRLEHEGDGLAVKLKGEKLDRCPGSEIRIAFHER